MDIVMDTMAITITITPYPLFLFLFLPTLCTTRQGLFDRFPEFRWTAGGGLQVCDIDEQDARLVADLLPEILETGEVELGAFYKGGGIGDQIGVWQLVMRIRTDRLGSR
jgi:hypothetical protein